MAKYYNIEDIPLALSAMDVSRVLGISKYSAYCLMRSEGFPMMRLGRRLLVQKRAFLDWVDEHFYV